MKASAIVFSSDATEASRVEGEQREHAEACREEENVRHGDLRNLLGVKWSDRRQVSIGNDAAAHKESIKARRRSSAVWSRMRAAEGLVRPRNSRKPDPFKRRVSRRGKLGRTSTMGSATAARLVSSSPRYDPELVISRCFTSGFIATRILSKRQVKELVLYSPRHVARLEVAGQGLYFLPSEPSSGKFQRAHSRSKVVTFASRSWATTRAS